MDKPFEKRCRDYKKITVLIAFLFNFAIIFANSSRFAKINVSYAAGNASAYAVIDVDSKEIIMSENADEPLPIASTTKILTALTVIENVFDLDEEVTIPVAACGIEGSSIYLTPGERLSYRDLLYGLMLRSGNAAAVALAVLTGGCVVNFVILMNEPSRKYGAVNSNFANPHGLDDEKHKVTARDLARISAFAMENDTFKEIVSAKYYKTSGDAVRYMKNKNKMLFNYEGADGVKTGYTKKSGRCLVASAERNGRRFVSVVINRYNMWQDSENLLNKAFEQANRA